MTYSDAYCCFIVLLCCYGRREDGAACVLCSAVQDMLQCCQSQCGWCVDEIQCEGWVGECSLLSGVQQSDALREEEVLRSAGSGPDGAVPSA